MERMKFDSEQQDKEEMLRSMYHEINSLQRAVHEHNQKWIHSGLRTMFIVPWLFAAAILIGGCAYFAVLLAIGGVSLEIIRKVPKVGNKLAALLLKLNLVRE